MYFAWSHKYSIWFRAAGSFIPAAWLKGLLGLINKRAHPSLQRRYFTFTRDTKITRSQLEPKQVQFYWTGDFKRLELTPGLRKRVHWIRIRCSSATSPPDPGCLGYLTPRSECKLWRMAGSSGWWCSDTPREGGREERGEQGLCLQMHISVYVMFLYLETRWHLTAVCIWVLITLCFVRTKALPPSLLHPSFLLHLEVRVLWARQEMTSSREWGGGGSEIKAEWGWGGLEGKSRAEKSQHTQ